MSAVQAKQIAGYVIMPGIVPRLKTLFTSGFDYIAFLMAQIYAMVRLLPANHAYLNPQNIGKYSIRNVVAQAANNLVLKKENTDQIIIFGAILIGLVLLVIQFAMIIFALVFEPAMAAFPTGPHPTGMSTFGSMFRTADPTFDIAFMLLDQVFGIPGLYGSCIDLNVACGGTVNPTPAGGLPWPFHTALHQLFRFYNTGILVVGALIFLYFLVIVVGETAVTGTPFGQRFQNIWVPIRLVVALGLLVPINFGLNSGQYITLFAAQFGSSMATNGWVVYNNTIRTGGVFPGGAGANPLGERESLIGNPKIPDFTPLLEAMSLVYTCAMGEWYASVDKPAVPPAAGDKIIQAYFYKNAPNWMPDTRDVLTITPTTTYANALQFFNNGDITVRFGINGDDPVNTGSGGAPGNDNNTIDNDEEESPICGEIKISIHQVGGAAGIVGPEAVQQYYFETLVRDMWFSPRTYELDSFGYRFASLKLQNGTTPPNFHSCNSPGGIPTIIPGRIGNPPPPVADCDSKPATEWRTHNIGLLNGHVGPQLTSIWSNYANATNLYEMNSDILRRGWAGAGIWYNTISGVNGNYMSSVREIPKFSQYPLIMTKILEGQNRENENITSTNKYCPNDSDISASADQKNIGFALCDVYKYWNEQAKNPITNEVEITGSAFEDAMNLIFGTQPLSAMTAENASTHPLAQLALLGKGLVDASIRNIATATAVSAIGGIATVFDKIIPGLIAPSADFILSTAFVGLTAGLVLYYIVPFLPFIYFFFAVASWVKSIFEAMVGVPLWALAHLRLDGEGLPGNSAANGYFLILEIFIRPILTVFGLLAATLIFTAQVRVLHFLWSLVTENLTGFDSDPTITVGGVQRFAFKRSIIDQFFFNIIYAIIVYMMAIAAFKLIDKIPDNLLRWMGNSVSSFGDINQDNVDGLTRYAALGGATAGRELASGVQQFGSKAGGTMGTMLSRLTGGP